MDILYGTKINQLLANTTPTGLLFADWLKKKDYSVQLQKKYRDSGWLTAICKGVMCRTGARLNAYDAIASYNKQMGGTLRVAAMSALEYTGFNHYVPMGKPVLMVAAPTFKTPLWMQSDVYDATFRVFHTNAFSYTKTIERVTDSGTLYVYSPEQAFLECLILAYCTCWKLWATQGKENVFVYGRKGRILLVRRTASRKDRYWDGENPSM